VLRRARLKKKFSLSAMAGRTEDIYRAALERRYSSLRAERVEEARSSR
jgi:hypothetical protein